jgi:hypothetical protein
MQEGLYYRLFPANNYAPPDYLVLYFPNQTRYLLVQMGGMLTISGLLMLVIISGIYDCDNCYLQAEEALRDEE